MKRETTEECLLALKEQLHQLTDHELPASLVVHSDTWEKIRTSLVNLPKLPTILGIPICQSDFIPKNRVLLRDEHGCIIGILVLEEKDE